MSYWQIMAKAPQIIALLGILGPLFDKSASVSQPMVDAAVDATTELMKGIVPNFKNLSEEEIASAAKRLNDLAWQIREDIEDED